MKRRNFITGAAAAMASVPVTASASIGTQSGVKKIIELDHPVTCMTVYKGKLYVAGGQTITQLGEDELK